MKRGNVPARCTDLSRVEVWLGKFDPDYSPAARREKPHRRAAKIALQALRKGRDSESCP